MQTVKASHVLLMMMSRLKLIQMSWVIVIAIWTLNDVSRPLLLPAADAFQIFPSRRPQLVHHHHHLPQQHSFATRTTTTTTGIITTEHFMVLPLRSSSSGGSGGERAARLRREADIRRKISQLKQEGKLKKPQGDDDDDDDDDDEVRSVYEDKIRQKLGDKKSKLLGYSGSSRKDDDDDDDDRSAETASGVVDSKPRRQGQLGTLPQMQQEVEDEEVGYSRPSDDKNDEDRRNKIIDPSLFDDDDSDDDSDSSVATVEAEEEELVDIVARKMMEKRNQKERDERERLQAQARAALDAKEKERQAAATPPQTETATSTTVKQTTSGVGGSWSGGKDTNETSLAASDDLYKPKTGSWGAFPRPRDISKAYGGGRRVGPGYSNEEARAKSTEDTREKLRRYREKVGIDVQSEKDHASEIDEAIKIAGVAMQRGIYATAVSALEKVTKYCSSNSKIGGKVFLELAMAYEAVGRTQEAITVYRTLSRCRIEDIKHDAKRLLYGIEAIQFMKNEVGSKEFSRKKAKNTFIDTTGLANIASYFDDVYQTAYIDLDGGFYKKLTESVVRSSREARQVLLQATGAGEVRRQRIVQALRSLSRHFDDALQEEIEMNTVQEDVAVIDGKPIMERRPEEKSRKTGFSSSSSSSFDDFVLSDAAQMLENLNGDWRLQLLADKSGDGVKFFNNTEAWQTFDTQTKKFSSLTPSGFMNVQQSGIFDFDEKRILGKQAVEVSNVGVLGGILGGMGLVKGGATSVVKAPRQVISVDSILLVTRGVPTTKKPSQTNKNDEKDYFAVWRRVEPGTFSSRP